MLKVLFIGCHPDDIELGCSGTICHFLKKGYEVICVFLTKGERGGDPTVRVRESIEACERLGVRSRNIIFGNFKDTQVPESHETITFLEQVNSRNIFAAFIPSEHEVHQDHRRAAYCCFAALRNVPRLFAYESPTTTAQFTPNAFMNVTGYITTKWLALRCHRSQWKNRKMYLEYRSMLRLAAFRGRQAGVKFAEAFETIRNLIELPLATTIENSVKVTNNT